jgi:Xaa-Pro dipeptidase
VNAAVAGHREGVTARRARLRDLLEHRGLDAVVLRRAANVAWYTGGADTRVDHADPLGVAHLVVTREREYVLASTIEAPRMRDEQTPDFDVVEYTWYDGPPLRGLGAVGSDVGSDGAVELAPGLSELEVAAALDAACRRRGLFTPVLLAATDARIRRHRHALPFGATVERRCMLVVSAERGGLYANMTRMVWLDEPDADIASRQAACDEILGRMREEATRPGRTLADAFADVRRFYADAGFPGEERLHHQGGTTGYGSRETIATPSTRDPIQIGNAFAWNPSITGAKAEETFVLTADGPEVIAA